MLSSEKAYALLPRYLLWGRGGGGKAPWLSPLTVSHYGPTVLSHSVMTNSLQTHRQ